MIEKLELFRRIKIGLTILALMLLGIVSCEPTYGQTNELIEVNRDSLFTVFQNYELLKAWSDKAQEDLESYGLIVTKLEKKNEIQEAIIRNYDDVIVPGQEEIVKNLKAIIEEEKKIGKKKGRRGFIQGLVTGAGIVGAIIIFN